MDGAPLLDLEHLPVVAPATSEVEAFARDGYVVLEGVLSGEQHAISPPA